MSSYYVWEHLEGNRYRYHGFFSEDRLAEIMSLVLAGGHSVVIELAR